MPRLLLLLVLILTPACRRPAPPATGPAPGAVATVQTPTPITDAPAWHADLTTVKTPIHVVRGQLAGIRFTPTETVFDEPARKLTFRARTPEGETRTLEIQLFPPPGRSIIGTETLVSPGASGVAPHVYVWRSTAKSTPSSESFTAGYALRLRFNAAAAGRLGGEIYVCLPDETQSVFAGRFDAVIRRDR